MKKKLLPRLWKDFRRGLRFIKRTLFSGITRRWLFNIFGTIFIADILLVFMFCAFAKNSYYNIVRGRLRADADLIGNFTCRPALNQGGNGAIVIAGKRIYGNKVRKIVKVNNLRFRQAGYLQMLGIQRIKPTLEPRLPEDFTFRQGGLEFFIFRGRNFCATQIQIPQGGQLRDPVKLGKGTVGKVQMGHIPPVNIAVKEQ